MTSFFSVAFCEKVNYVHRKNYEDGTLNVVCYGFQMFTHVIHKFYMRSSKNLLNFILKAYKQMHSVVNERKEIFFKKISTLSKIRESFDSKFLTTT